MDGVGVARLDTETPGSEVQEHLHVEDHGWEAAGSLTVNWRLSASKGNIHLLRDGTLLMNRHRMGAREHAPDQCEGPGSHVAGGLKMDGAALAPSSFPSKRVGVARERTTSVVGAVLLWPRAALASARAE